MVCLEATDRCQRIVPALLKRQHLMQPEIEVNGTVGTG
jgi:hypothetical protein